MTIDAEYGSMNEVKVGHFTRDMTTASGTQAVTGLGFKPSVVLFLACKNGAVGEMSIGWDDASNLGVMYDGFQVTADAYWIRTDRSIEIVQSGANYYYGVLNSRDSDGFTVSWTKNGSPSGTLVVMYMVFK